MKETNQKENPSRTLALTDLLPRQPVQGRGVGRQVLFGIVSRPSPDENQPTVTAKDKVMKLRQTPFNMVEIVLALVVIVIGVVGILALLPASQVTAYKGYTRDHAQNASDQYLRLMSSQLKRRWAITGAIPISKPPVTAEGGVTWSNADSGEVITPVEGIALFYNDEDNDGMFDYQLDDSNRSRDDSGLFRLVQRSAANIEDFAAILRVWQTPATYKTYNVAAGQMSGLKPVPPDAGITLNVELSYPASIPYARRDKSVYMLDVFRPTQAEPVTIAGALQINQPGKLRFTYHGSEAGLTSGFWMLEPELVEIFASNKKTDQKQTYERVFDGGTTFNFFSRTYASSWGMSTYDHYAWADPIENECSTLAGDVNINPQNRPDYEFTLTTDTGREITRDDLHNKSIITSSGVFYSGPATRVWLRPKGNGNDNQVTLNGVVYPLKNNSYYEITSSNLVVSVYNDKVNNGRAMGHWWVNFNSACMDFGEDGQILKFHPGRRSQNGMPYYDNPPTDRNGAYCYLTGNPYCMVAEMIPGRKWLLGFEDLPGDRNGDGILDWIDWDYNDIVVSVELLTQDGVSQLQTGVTVAGTIDLDPNHTDMWRVSLTKADGSFVDGTTMPPGGYNGPAIALWARPSGAGSQSVTVNGVNTAFQNEQMLSVCAEQMSVNIRQVGGQWKATISNCPNAIFVVME